MRLTLTQGHGCASMEWAPLCAHETQALVLFIIWFGTRDPHLNSRVSIRMVMVVDVSL